MIPYIQGFLAALAGLLIGFWGAFGLTAPLPSLSEPVAEPYEEVITITPLAVDETAAPTEEIQPEEKPDPVATQKVEIEAEVVPTTQNPEPLTPSFETLNIFVRAAVVNILCTSRNSGLNSITASGVVVDPRGVILTNAHVAQYLLLRDYPSPDSIECVVRTGSPAVPKYTVDLLFLSPSWILENARKINDETPMGNGSHDYALLAITGTVNPSSALPDAFAAVSISNDLPALGQDTLIAGYPAGFLGGAIIQKDLHQTSAFTTVEEVFTFEESTIDLFSIGGSVIAQSGSSGGAVTNMQGELLGLIVTSTDAPETGERDLRALSMPYLMRDFHLEAGQTIDGFLSHDLIELAQTFRVKTEPALIKQLVEALESGGL